MDRYLRSAKMAEKQGDKFKKAAREIGADEENASAADALMGRLAHTPPDPKPKPNAIVKRRKTKPGA